MSQQQKLAVIRAELERAESYRRLLYGLSPVPQGAVDAITATINALQDAYCKTCASK